VPRPRLLRYVLRGLEQWLDKIRQGDYAELEAEWNRFSAMQDKEVRFTCGGEEIEGRILAAGIREGLLVRLPTGQDRRFRLEHLNDLRFVTGG
jgi:biotin-(acetyl-CoA carboxylase) ligase